MDSKHVNDPLDQYLADLEASRPDTHDLTPERDEDDIPSPPESWPKDDESWLWPWPKAWDRRIITVPTATGGVFAFLQSREADEPGWWWHTDGPVKSGRFDKVELLPSIIRVFPCGEMPFYISIPDEPDLDRDTF